MENFLKHYKNEIINISKNHGAYNIRVFGSFARGDNTDSSDVDLLVEFEEGKSLIDHIALIQDLEDLLGCKVDIVTENAIHWYIKDKVLQEAIAL